MVQTSKKKLDYSAENEPASKKTKNLINNSNSTIASPTITTSTPIEHNKKRKYSDASDPEPKSSEKEAKPMDACSEISTNCFKINVTKELWTQSKALSALSKNIDSEKNIIEDSRVEGKNILQYLLRPMLVDDFFNQVWEKKALLIKRSDYCTGDYYKDWFSTAEFDQILENEDIQFSRNIDITKYKNSKRITLNPDGRAYPSIVWKHYKEGCSVRFLNPQTYSHHLWQRLSLLQDHFTSFVGANMYLTPPGSKGFAPHFDDIEAFLIQLEGRKRWKVYAPTTKRPCKSEFLPFVSSDNFEGDEKKKGELGIKVIDVVLEPGDLLYFPRGFVHHASTLPDVHSLHVTISTYQTHTWGHLMEKIMSSAINSAMENDVFFRRGLPPGFQNYTGIIHEDKQVPERLDFFVRLSKSFKKMAELHFNADAACDEIARDNVYHALPPCLTEAEKMRTIHKSGFRWNSDSGEPKGSFKLTEKTKLKFVRAGVTRLVSDLASQSLQLYYSTENSRVYHEVEPRYLEVEFELAPAIEFLLDSYPAYVAIQDFPLENPEDKMTIACELFNHGLLMTEK